MAEAGSFDFTTAPVVLVIAGVESPMCDDDIGIQRVTRIAVLKARAKKLGAPVVHVGSRGGIAIVPDDYVVLDVTRATRALEHLLKYLRTATLVVTGDAPLLERLVTAGAWNELHVVVPRDCVVGEGAEAFAPVARAHRVDVCGSNDLDLGAFQREGLLPETTHH